MTLEAPIQIDLSQENSWDQVDDSTLTPEEKALLRDHFREESDAIIYLTQGELQRLKDIISVNDIPAQADFREFITQQGEEGLSLQDLLEGMEGIPEGLGELGAQIDTISHEALFGENGLMDGVELTATAKDNIGVSLSVTALQTLGNLEGLTPESIQTELQNIVNSLTSIRTIFSQTETTDEGDTPYTSIVDIAGGGDFNTIFTNNSEGITFFQGVMSGSITEDQIESYIEERNREEGHEDLQNIPLGEIGQLSGDAMQALIARLTPSGEDINRNPSGAPIPVPEDPVERQSYIEELENGNFLEKMLAAILKALSAIGLVEIDDDGNIVEAERTEVGPEPEEVAAQRVERVRQFFLEHADEGVFVGMSRSSIEALFPSSGELPEEAQNILNLIDQTPPLNGNINEKMEHLFIDPVPKVDGDSSQGEVPRLERFLSDMREVTGTQVTINDNGALHTNGLLTAINYYKSYRERNEDWVDLPENSELDRDMTFREYFEEISQEED